MTLCNPTPSDNTPTKRLLHRNPRQPVKMKSAKHRPICALTAKADDDHTRRHIFENDEDQENHSSPAPSRA